MPNNNLANAKKAKNDEFYTQFSDIQKEIGAYLEYDPDTFRDKVVYCNCDDPFESNFFRYFALNFKKLGLKRLITTSYKPSPIANTELVLQPSFLPDYEDLVVSKPTEPKGRPKVTANKFVINDVGDMNSDGEFNMRDIAEQLKTNKHNEWEPLKGDGDFRSPECVELLKQSDIVVTNPPFSLFREYIKQLFDFNKKFVIIGNMNAITYKEIFRLIKNNKMWLGAGKNDGRNIWYQVPDSYTYYHKIEDEKKYAFVAGTVWFTNLDHGRLHRQLPLMNEADVVKFSMKMPFRKYYNYDAIEVSLVKNIPCDYKGAMGVPISFLSKYSPDQFKIIGLGISNSGIEVGVRPYEPEHKKYRKEIQRRGAVDGDLYMMVDGVVTVPYARILIKHRGES